MSSMLINAEFSERIARAFKILPAYAHLTGIPVNKVRSFAETLLDFSDVSGKNSPRFSRLIGYQVPMQLCIKLFFDESGFGLLADILRGDTFLSRCYFQAGNPPFDTLELMQTCVLRPITEELPGIFGPCDPQYLDKLFHGVL